MTAGLSRTDPHRIRGIQYWAVLPTEITRRRPVQALGLHLDPDAWCVAVSIKLKRSQRLSTRCDGRLSVSWQRGGCYDRRDDDGSHPCELNTDSRSRRTRPVTLSAHLIARGEQASLCGSTSEGRLPAVAHGQRPTGGTAYQACAARIRPGSALRSPPGMVPPRTGRRRDGGGW